MEGILAEKGPHWPRGHISLLPADEHWNLDANVLYLASPAGVGYSYSLSQIYQTDDQPGFGVRNRRSNYQLKGDTQVEFCYDRGLIGNDLWASVNTYCCSKGHFFSNSDDNCFNVVSHPSFQ
ncbi:hypothetical protein mRhiFer1_009193 [Rhinolophus ferrumequinum]|uniref:Uncharacterized protein n=1 Tax=Rhinolophus ferrumequinum TaxID=59479 RepID=A0A7J7SK78_RHIFE|nr:hypothetical protein mRhiFer1_009193 [Rhinolophus ferrumequinum]